MRGINPKRWFYDLRRALDADANARVIFAGAACEQWLNGQLFSVIAAGLRGTDLTAYPEWRKRDCAIFKVDDSGESPVADWTEPLEITESKVLYLNYGPSKRVAYIRRLVEQLATDDQVPRRVGFVFAIYSRWLERGKGTESFLEFRRNVGTMLRAALASPPPGFQVVVAKPAMETLLPEAEVKVGASRVVVGCVGQYVLVQPEE